jgi:hypothetical protein
MSIHPTWKSSHKSGQLDIGRPTSQARFTIFRRITSEHKISERQHHVPDRIYHVMNSLIARKCCPSWHLIWRSAVFRDVNRPSLAGVWLRRASSAVGDQQEPQIQKTRNIGIIAHIDAVRIFTPSDVFALIPDLEIGENNDNRAHALLQWE